MKNSKPDLCKHDVYLLEKINTDLKSIFKEIRKIEDVLGSKNAVVYSICLIKQAQSNIDYLIARTTEEEIERIRHINAVNKGYEMP